MYNVRMLDSDGSEFMKLGEFSAQDLTYFTLTNGGNESDIIGLCIAIAQAEEKGVGLSRGDINNRIVEITKLPDTNIIDIAPTTN